MKTIKYKLGAHEATMPYSEANLVLAKAEALNGIFTIEDDGTDESTTLSTNDRLKQIEQFLAKLKPLFPDL